MKRVVSIAIMALLLAAAPASADLVEAFDNPAPISVPGNGGTSGPGSPYPSSVVVDGRVGPVTGVSVTLRNVNLQAARDLRAVLVSPSGRTATVMYANCGTGPLTTPSMVISEGAIQPMPVNSPCTDVAYQPNPVANTENLPGPAPLAPYGSSLDVFKGANPNGTWKLYTHDDQGGGSGTIAGGWTLTLSTRPEAVDMKLPAAGTFYVASRYPSMLDVSGETGVITDLNVQLFGVWHQRPDDLDLLLVGPQGQTVVLMSDACGPTDPEGARWTWDDEADLGMQDTNLPCSSRSYRPVDFEPGETWPAPAPAGPHGTDLSAFDLTDPNGTWRLYATDDQTGAAGFVTNRFMLEMTTRPRAQVAFTENAVRVREGKSREIILRRSAPDLLAAQVRVTTTPAGAASGRDFTPVSSVVEFAAGQSEATVRIDALADRVAEKAERYRVVVDSPTGDAETAGSESVVVTIPAPPRCLGRLATIVGTAGRDVLRGTGRHDVIVGLGGADRIRSRGGGDLVCAGAGGDRVFAGSGRDRLAGGTGADRLAGGAGRDRCRGGQGRDRVRCESR